MTTSSLLQVSKGGSLVNIANRLRRTVTPNYEGRSRILFIAPHGFHESIEATAVLSRIIEDDIGTAITIICDEENYELFESVPNVADRRIYPKDPSFKEKMSLMRWAWPKRWARIIDLRGDDMFAQIPAQSRAAVRPPIGETDKEKSAGEDSWLALTAGHTPTIWFRAPHVSFVMQNLPDKGPLIGIGACAAGRAYRWPTVKFAELLKRLQRKDSMLHGAKFVLFGPARDFNDQAPLRHALKHKSMIDLVGKTDILTAAACLQKLDLFIGNASEYLWLCQTTQTPAVALISSTAPAGHAPRGGDHITLRGQLNPFDRVEAGSGVKLLSVDAVEKAVVEAWSIIEESRRAGKSA